MIRLLDLFCGAGGAAKGYTDAGYLVTGIDLIPQPHYPYSFMKADVMRLPACFLQGFDIIHASPPCQAYSTLSKGNGTQGNHPDLVAAVRAMLAASGKSYIIENVPGAPLRDPLLLCGTMFSGLRVLRHRLFETSFPVVSPPHGPHPRVHTFDKRVKHFGKTDEMIDFVQVTGGGNCTLAAASSAMGIDWMTKQEINQAIPPAYTHYIGNAFRESL